jgi:hypothetical protein
MASSHTSTEFIDLFPQIRDQLLVLLLRYASKASSDSKGATLGVHQWNALREALAKLVVRILPAYGRHCQDTKHLGEIFADEDAHWEYRDWAYGVEDRGDPSIRREHLYPLPGVELVPVPSADHAGSGWELYWTDNETLLLAEREAHQLHGHAQESPSLAIDDILIHRTITPISIAETSPAELLCQLSSQQLCTLLEQMFAAYQRALGIGDAAPELEALAVAS